MRETNLNAGLIGKDGRTSAIERCLLESPRINGPVLKFTEWKSERARNQILARAREENPDFVIVGPEEPLADGIVDSLQELGIPCVGPTRSLARLESSKAFTRELLKKHNIPGNPEYRVFSSVTGVEQYLEQLGEYVVKPDGLTGGKGVKLSGAHLFSNQQAVSYCDELFRSGHAAVVIEEKLEGEEFSLQSFCDGINTADMVIVQDHKRAHEGDTGPNTGGMGSYSCPDHSLPFLRLDQVKEASSINSAVARALIAETGQKFKGILYGGFMLTANGVRLLEYNARFGDPETMNVLSLLETDLVDICEVIIDEKLNQLPIRFQKKATVCKYVVPEGYPDNPIKGAEIDLSAVPGESPNLRIYRAAVEERGGKLYMTGSRAIAIVGIGTTLTEAEQIAERAASSVKGSVFHRKDIGTEKLIQKRIQHVRILGHKSLKEKP
jgi:phosphoribosylamine--glycine ligase